MGSTFKAATMAALIGAGVSVGFHLLSLSIGIFPVPLLVLYLLLCPAGVLFMATAGCDSFDSCTLLTLLAVTGLNAFLYAAVVFGFVCQAKYRRRKISVHREDA